MGKHLTYVSDSADRPPRGRARGRPRKTPQIPSFEETTREPMDWAPLFLTDYAIHGTIGPAAAAAGVTRKAVVDRQRSDPKFAAAMEDAREAVVDQIEKRAVELSTQVFEPSEKMIMFMLRARRDKVYGEKARLEVTGANGEPVGIALGLRQLHDQMRARDVTPDAPALEGRNVSTEDE